MAEWSAFPGRSYVGPAFSRPGVLDSQSRSVRYPNRYLDLFLGSPEFKSLAMLVNSQLVCLRLVGILNNAMFNLKYLFQLFARSH